MTDTVDDVVVWGQRRPNGSSGSFGGGGGSPQPGPTVPSNPTEPPLEPTETWHPCQDPVTAKEWNKDAAAAAGLKKIQQAAAQAGENGITYRERGAWLLQQPDGSIIASEPFDGSIFQPGVIPSTNFPFNGINPAQIVGFIHNHGPGFHSPSYNPATGYGDAAGMREIISRVNQAGGNGDGVRMYIAAQTTTQPTYDKINVYTQASADAATQNGQVGPEVDPEGVPCSAYS